jgi:heterodisulfide reductase subunit D
MQIELKKIQETKALYCLECGKCTGTCPVAVNSNSFSPRRITARSFYNSHPAAYVEENIYACLTCKQCDEICPSDIKIIDLVRILRQHLEPDTRKESCSHGGILESICQIMTAPSLNQNRTGWLNGELKTSKDSEWLYFVGCLPYFDTLFSDIEVDTLNIARSSMKILNHFNIKPQVLANEKCCGHDMYWNGDMETFELLARSNLEQFEKSGAKNILTSCPECYRTLKLEYPKYFGRQKYTVYHISEFLEEKLQSANIVNSDAKLATFHDPCRLGRHMGVYDAPRNVLNQIENLSLVEMRHNRKRATCCGVSGWKNCSQVSKSIQVKRLKEARATGADMMITSCAKCKIHFTCAMKDENLNNEISIEIKDLAEVVAENLQ